MERAHVTHRAIDDRPHGATASGDPGAIGP
jgi:hypothetical protein